jgi:hypothetical protein
MSQPLHASRAWTLLFHRSHVDDYPASGGLALDFLFLRSPALANASLRPLQHAWRCDGPRVADYARRFAADKMCAYSKQL